jgi:hypothetical protein
MSRSRGVLFWFAVLLLAAAGAVWYFRPDLLPARLAQALPSHPRSPPLSKYRDDRGQQHPAVIRVAIGRP